MLSCACGGPIFALHHLFVPDNMSLLDDDVIDCRGLSHLRQLTDVYLFVLAVEHRCRLVTLGGAISLAAVRRADSPSLVVI